MNKLMLLGLLLFLVGILFLGIVGFNSNATFLGSENATPQSAIIGAYSRINVSIYMNGTQSLTIEYIAKGPVNFYLFNSTGFSNLQSFPKNESLQDLPSDEGPIGQYLNSSTGIFQNLMPQGTYYAVFENRNNTNVTIGYAVSHMSISPSTILAKANSFVFFATAGAILFFVGIVLVLYGFVTRKKGSEQMNPAEVEKAYDSVEGRKRRRKRQAGNQ